MDHVFPPLNLAKDQTWSQMSCWLTWMDSSKTRLTDLLALFAFPIVMVFGWIAGPPVLLLSEFVKNLVMNFYMNFI